MAKKVAGTKKRVVKVDANGQLHVHSSFNNIIVTITNGEGQVISWPQWPGLSFYQQMSFLHLLSISCYRLYRAHPGQQVRPAPPPHTIAFVSTSKMDQGGRRRWK